WVGDVAILGVGPQPGTVKTATNCVLFVLGARAVLSFAVSLPGLRRGFFPGTSAAEARERVRELRRAGLPKWKQVRLSVLEEPTALPAWLRTYPARTVRRVPRPAKVVRRPAIERPPRLSRGTRLVATVCLVVLAATACSFAFIS